MRFSPPDKYLAAFTGTGVEWFGCTGPTYGAAEVYIHGHLAQRTHANLPQLVDLGRLVHPYDRMA